MGQWFNLILSLSLRDPKQGDCARGRVDRVEKGLFLILLYIHSMSEIQKGRGKKNSREGEGMSYLSVVCVNIQVEEINLMYSESC